MGLSPVVTPKLMCESKCVGCGHCAIGCPTDAKWNTRKLVEQAVQKGATLVTNCKVTLEEKNRWLASPSGEKTLQMIGYL